MDPAARDTVTRAEMEQHFEMLRAMFTAQLKESEERGLERSNANREYLVQALTAQERAVTKAEQSTERRLESLNEIRGLMSDQQRTYIPRAEYESQHASLRDTINARSASIEAMVTVLRERFDKLEGKGAGASLTISYIISGIGIVAVILAIADRFIK